MKPAIEIKHISKKYRKGSNSPYLTLRDKLAGIFGPRKSAKLDSDEFWALKDINLNIMPGEVVGIIGRNGAGKSTLLKILSRITHPTQGEVILRGRVGSLLEVGTGFHQELTGRENIFLNGAVLGMGRTEVKRKFDEIVAFAEIDKFIDTPVKHYSSGMYMRLAFAVAAHLETEILLVDEVLAVGDIQFQEKCMGKMSEISKNGRTILFVSHNLGAIKTLCNKCILIEDGKISDYGESGPLIERYLSKINSSNHKHGYNVKFPKNDIAKISKIYVTQNENTIPYDKVQIDKNLEIKIFLTVYKKTQGLRLYVDLMDINDNIIVRTSHDSLLNKRVDFNQGKHQLELSIPANTLAPKKYIIKAVLTIFNVETLNPDGIRIPIQVSGNSNFNTLYPTEEIKGFLAPTSFTWKIN